MLPSRSHERVTIRDVARAAGVSVATVSKVVNGRDGIAEATSERVRAVVDELGYESSLVATSMRRRRTGVIGVLVAEFEPFALQLLQGVSDALAERGYDVLAYAGSVSGGPAGWERRSLSRLGGTLIDGAILVTPTVTLAQTPVPVVAIDPHTGPAGPVTVDTDNLDGARTAMTHLLELGHRRIGHVRGRADLESAQLREQGYREALAEAGIRFDDALVAEGGYRSAEAARAAATLLDLDDPPTAVFAANDVSAIETMRIAHERGLRVPDDLSVVGFDDIPDATSCQPTLTTIQQPLHEMGVRAVTALLELLAGADVDHLRLPTRLVARESTGAPRVR